MRLPWPFHSRNQSPYASYSEDELLDNFKTENWTSLDSDQRIAVLQEMENRRAAEQGRPIEKIHPLNEPNYYGYYSSEDKGIYVDIENFGPYQALDTYIHESNHARQEHCQNADPYTQAIFDVQNIPGIYHGDGPAYDMQSLEQDSNNQALRFMLDQKERFGEDPSYQEYIQNRAEHFENVNHFMDNHPGYQQLVEQEQVKNAYMWNSISGEEHDALIEKLNDPDYRSPVVQETQQLNQELQSYNQQINQDRIRQSYIDYSDDLRNQIIETQRSPYLTPEHRQERLQELSSQLAEAQEHYADIRASYNNEPPSSEEMKQNYMNQTAALMTQAELVRKDPSLTEEERDEQIKNIDSQLMNAHDQYMKDSLSPEDHKQYLTDQYVRDSQYALDECTRINNDPSLSEEERNQALDAQQEKLNSLRDNYLQNTMSPEDYQNYREGQYMAKAGGLLEECARIQNDPDLSEAEKQEALAEKDQKLMQLHNEYMGIEPEQKQEQAQDISSEESIESAPQQSESTEQENQQNSEQQLEQNSEQSMDALTNAPQQENQQNSEKQQEQNNDQSMDALIDTPQQENQQNSEQQLEQNNDQSMDALTDTPQQENRQNSEQQQEQNNDQSMDALTAGTDNSASPSESEKPSEIQEERQEQSYNQ